MEAAIKTAGELVEKIDFTPAAGTNEGEAVGTNFERKYRKEEKPIYTIAVRKIKYSQ
jgi:hypothetical protein